MLAFILTTSKIGGLSRSLFQLDLKLQFEDFDQMIDSVKVGVLRKDNR